MADSHNLEEKLDQIISLLTILVMQGLFKGDSQRNPTPYIPPMPDRSYTPHQPSKCGVCNMVFERSMGYVCPRNDCPSRVTCQ